MPFGDPLRSLPSPVELKRTRVARCAHAALAIDSAKTSPLR